MEDHNLASRSSAQPSGRHLYPKVQCSFMHDNEKNVQLSGLQGFMERVGGGVFGVWGFYFFFSFQP